MKLGTYAEALAPESSETRSTIQVCMHVWGTARKDVRVMREATALAQAGMAVTVIDIETDEKRPREEDIDGIHVKHVVISNWYKPSRFKPRFLVKIVRMFLRGTLEMLKTPADVYHAHEEIALPACYMVARLRRKALIFDAHELPLVEPIVTRWRLLCTLSRQLLKIMMPCCAGVITVSPPIMQELRRRYGGRRAVVVRNIPAYQAPGVSNCLRHYLELGLDTRIALYQGNLDSRGLDRLIPAARFLDPGIVLVMMGGRDGSLQAQFEALIEREGVGDRVKMIPPVPYAELLSWTASADIGLVVYAPCAASTMTLNIQMCLPNKLFEYLMAGVPVLASSLDAVADIITTYDVGRIVESHEPEEIGRAISAMLADPDALQRMRRNALDATRHDLCWESESQRLIDLYTKVMDTRHAASGSAKSFDARRYWEERLQAHPDITGVGYLGRSPEFVKNQYRSRIRRIELVLRKYGLSNLAGRSVLDVGSGTGIWLNFWHRHIAGQVVGLDFARPSVERLKRQFPGDLIVQADLSVVPLPLPESLRFDVISAFDVLLHIVEPDALRRALANLAAHCVPGGWLIISDPIVQGGGYVRTAGKAAYSKVRSLEEYREVLEAVGFTIASIRPATVLLSDPLEAPNRPVFLALAAWWKATWLWGRSNRYARLLGPATTQLDQLACHLCSAGNAPGAKIILARKQG